MSAPSSALRTICEYTKNSSDINQRLTTDVRNTNLNNGSVLACKFQHYIFSYQRSLLCPIEHSLAIFSPHFVIVARHGTAGCDLCPGCQSLNRSNTANCCR